MIRIKIVMIFILLGINVLSYAQQSEAWKNWDWLLGEWSGEGSGEPGQGDGAFSFKLDLDNNILRRISHSEYPSREGNSILIHEDLMIVYLDSTKKPTKAIYFDNEGHTINYEINYLSNSIQFTSNRVANNPIFRLTYTLLDNDLVNTKFEMSFEGGDFNTYIEGKSVRQVN